MNKVKLFKTTAICLALGISAQSHGAELAKVTINQAFQSLLYLPLYVAKDEGFFKQQGVEVKISTGGGGAQSWAAVIGGSADFSIQDPVFVPKSREMGADGVVVAAVQNAPTVFIFGKDGTSLQNNLKALAGKRVVTSPQPDTTWAFMSYLTKQRGIKNVKFVHVPIGNEIPAVAAGRADYALAVEPQVSQAEELNKLPIVYSFSANKDWFPFAFSSLTTTNSYLAKHPKRAQAVVTAFEQASQFIYKDTDKAIAIADKYFSNLPKDIVRQAVMRNVKAKGYPEHVLVTKESWDHNMNIAAYAKNIKGYPTKATSWKNNVNTALAEKAEQIVDGK